MAPLSYEEESAKRTEGFNCIAGVDEVGRGPWAGPVVAAAVVLDPRNIPEGMKDSKKISPKKREQLYGEIMETSLVGVGSASVEEIDTVNIRQATFLAMCRALKDLPTKPDFAFVDGRDIPAGITIPAEAVIKGDNKVLSVSAASIVAKVTRDNFMAELAEKHPHFAWEKNAGYGTKAHQEGLSIHGITPHHRKSFAPIKALLTS
jgi:ribonuclease HII